MLHELVMLFQSFPIEGKVLSVASLIFLAFGCFGMAHNHWPIKEDTEVEVVEAEPSGWRKYLLEPLLFSAFLCGIVLECNLLIGFALVIVFAPVWLLAGFFGCPYKESAFVGIPAGLFLAAKVLLATGIAER